MSTWPWPTLEKHPPLTAEQVGALWPMIGLDNAWRTKAKMVSYIGSFVGGTWLTAPELGEWIGLSAGRTRVLLAELAGERVILRDGGRAANPRVFWVEIHPNVAGWRRVPWIVTDFELRRRLLDHGSQVIDLEALERAILAAADRLDARPLGARCDFANARLLTARWQRSEGVWTRAQGTRDPGGGGGVVSRGHRGARPAPLVSRALGRASSAATAPVVVPTGCDNENSPPLDGAGAGGGADLHVDENTLRHARSVIVRKARGRFLNGAPLDQLRRLLQRVELDEVLELVATAPEDLGVPRLVEWLDLHAGVPPLEVSTAVDLDAERQRLDAAIANRRAMLEVYERSEAEPELIESCRAELEACETRRAEIDKQQQEGAA